MSYVIDSLALKLFRSQYKNCVNRVNAAIASYREQNKKIRERVPAYLLSLILLQHNHDD